MDIEWIQLRNFQSYLDLDLKLTPGLTLVVGDNGAGKSTVIEAIAWSLYGETIRGADPCMKGQLSQASVIFQHEGAAWQVTRARGVRGGTTLNLSRNQQDQSGQTATETQAKIDRLLGPWHRFKSTRVFAREFMARFGAASDKERKALLEDILGLEQFDRALTISRDRLRGVERASAAAGAKRSVLETEMDKAGHEHSAATAMTNRTSEEVSEDIEKRDTKLGELTTRVTSLKGYIRSVREDIDNYQGAAAAARGKMEAAAARVAQLEKRLSVVEGSSTCPTCYREFGDDGKEAARSHYAEELATTKAERVSNETVLYQNLDEVKNLKEELAGLEKQLAEVEREQGVLRSGRLDQELVLAQQQEKRAAELASKVESLGEQVKDATKDCDRLAKEQQVLALSADAFGLRGARTLLLGRALTRLEGEANQVLSALGLPVEVAISGTTTQKTGKEVDTISVALKGAGGGDYDAASSGERARVDVALLLGLASMLGAPGAGWLAFDEVFDALDQDGIDRVATFLADLSSIGGRQVLVVSHHLDLRSMFPRGVVLKATKDDALGSSLEIV